MNFKKATLKDIDVILQVISDARTRIGKLGIDQWQYGYPTRSIVIEDVNLGRTYLAEEDGKILAVFAVIDDGEPTYDKIYDGKWVGGGKYLAVHRIAVAQDCLRGGIASSAMNFVGQMAKEKGYASVRIDTHEGNLPMRGMLRKNGYFECGIIYLTDGQKRIAYEKIV